MIDVYLKLFLFCCVLTDILCSHDDDVGVLREVWTNVAGDSLQNLLADSRFPHRPTVVKFIKSFDAPIDNSNEISNSNNAQRIKGYFIAPQDGEYKFHSSCGGACEVFLGMNGMEGENNRIISQTKSSKRNEFERFADQVSHSMALQKGKRYYIEAISKQEENSDNNLSVGVELPDGEKMFPIPRSLLRKSKTSKDGKSDDDDDVSVSIQNILTPRKRKFNQQRYKKKNEATVTGENRELHKHKKKSHNHNVPVVDFEGKKFNDKDAVEPGINIFSEDKEEFSGEESNQDEDSDQSTSEMKEGDENVEFSVADKVSSPKLKSDETDEGSQMVEANFGSGNQSLADALKHHMKSSTLKVIMPGGKQVKLSGNKKEEKDSTTPEESESVTIDSANVDLNNSVTDSVARKIQDVNFTSKKTKTAHIMTEEKSKQRSFYGGEYGGGGGGFGGMGGEGGYGMNHMGNMDGHGYGMGHGGLGVGMLPMTDHGMTSPDHGAMPEGHGHDVAEMHHTGAVAMIPALLHHDHSEYDHDTGELHEGGTHVEPLVPIHGGAVHGGDLGIGHVGSNMMTGHGGPDIGMGNGGGMEHSLGMMPPHGIDIDHGMGGHHMPDLHAPLPDEHHDYHHHLEPLPVMPAAPVAPVKPHKPDVIKVEFVPEEVTVEAVNKSNIGSPNKKAGTVRVQFIPGDESSQSPPPQYATARHNAPVVKDVSSQQSKGTTSSVKPQISTTKVQERVSHMMKAATAKTDQQSAPSKSKSVNGYEANPILPGELKTVESNNDVPTSRVESESAGLSGGSAKYTGGSSGGGGGGGSSFVGGGDGSGGITKFIGGGGGGGGGGYMDERIDPPLTSLGQKYENALQGDEKNAIANEHKAENAQGPDDKVYFGGGAPLAQPDPTPTEHSPAGMPQGGEQGFHGPMINPIANHLVEAMNKKAVSTEEALQMMNDFVSGNQDMNKAATNMEGMLGQISSHRHAVENNPDDMSQPEETQHFINSHEQVNPDLETGFTNPSYPKLHPEGARFSPEPIPNLFNEQSEPQPNFLSRQTMQYTGTQRDEANTSPNINTGNNIMARVNQMSPEGPPPPVHIFDGEKNNAPAPMRKPEDNNDLVMEPVQSNYDGFANPSLDKEIPSMPSDSTMNSIINKIDPRENPNEINSERVSMFSPSLEKAALPPHEVPNDQTFVQPESMPQVDFQQGAQQTPQRAETEPPQTEDSNMQAPSGPPDVSNAGQTYMGPPGTEMQYNDNSEADLPQGHIVEAPETYPGTVGFNQESNFVARKFQMPHKTGKTANLNQHLQKTKTKEQTGSRKHEVIADFYADSIFPEDYSDIESLKGSLQGKTLTNFDKQTEHHVMGSRRTLKKMHSEVKASFPLEGRVTKSEIEGSSNHHLKRQNKKRTVKRKGLHVKNRSMVKTTTKVDKKSKLEKNAKKHRTRRSLHEQRTKESASEKYQQQNGAVSRSGVSSKYVPRKSLKYFSHNTIKTSKNHKSSTRSESIANTDVKSLKQSRNVQARLSSKEIELEEPIRPRNNYYVKKARYFIRQNKLAESEPEEVKEDKKVYYESQPNAIQEDKATNNLYPVKTDWADIHPVSGQISNRVVELPLDSHVGVVDTSNKHVVDDTSSQLNGQISHSPNSETPLPQEPQNDRATLRRLVAELRDVLHRIHNVNPERHSAVDDGAMKAATNVLDEPDMAQFEAISKGDLLSAFANVGKPQPIHSVDIESYTQDVWEPGLKGVMGDSLYGPSDTFKRGMVPNKNNFYSKIKSKHFPEEMSE